MLLSPMPQLVSHDELHFLRSRFGDERVEEDDATGTGET